MKPFNLEEYLKKPSRKVITRDGRNAKIICTNYNSTQPIIAEIEGLEYAESFTVEGKYYIRDSQLDLFFDTKKHEGWVNVYLDADNDSYVGNWIYNSKEEAEELVKKRSGYKTTIKIEWEE